MRISVLTESSLDDIDNGLAGVNVGDNLTLSRTVFSSFFHDNDLGSKQVAHLNFEIRK